MVNNLPFQPKYNNVVVLPEEENESSSGGIIIPHNARVKLTQGKVIAAGPTVDPSILVGEDVIWTMHMEQRIQFDRQTYFVLKDTDILLGNAGEKQNA